MPQRARTEKNYGEFIAHFTAHSIADDKFDNQLFIHSMLLIVDNFQRILVSIFVFLYSTVCFSDLKIWQNGRSFYHKYRLIDFNPWQSFFQIRNCCLLFVRFVILGTKISLWWMVVNLRIVCMNYGLWSLFWMQHVFFDKQSIFAIVTIVYNESSKMERIGGYFERFCFENTSEFEISHDDTDTGRVLWKFFKQIEFFYFRIEVSIWKNSTFFIFLGGLYSVVIERKGRCCRSGDR